MRLALVGQAAARDALGPPSTAQRRGLDLLASSFVLEVLSGWLRLQPSR